MGKRPSKGCPCIFAQGPPSSKLRHWMQTIVTDIFAHCLSISLSVTWLISAVRAVCAGSFGAALLHFGLLLQRIRGFVKMICAI